MNRNVLWAPVWALLLWSCTAQVQHGLDERQANELQSVLVERGIQAQKVLEPGKKPTWAIEVDEERATDAVRILAELGLPRPRTEGFGDVFGKGSLVPTPTEERALYLEALSGEVARTLESVDGVVGARVHLVIPPPPRAGVAPEKAKAAAYLRLRPGHSERLGALRRDLQALIAGSVEGLSADDVTVMMTEVSSSVPQVTAPPKNRLRFLVVGLGAAVCGLAIAMVFLTLKLRSAPATAQVPAPPPAVAPPAKPVIQTNPPKKAVA